MGNTGIVCGRRTTLVGLHEPNIGGAFLGGDLMSTLDIILIIMTFVIPALAILGDNGQWSRKK